MCIWWQVYEDKERGNNEEQTLAFCKFKYTAETVARYFPASKIRKVKENSNWDYMAAFTTIIGD